MRSVRLIRHLYLNEDDDPRCQLTRWVRLPEFPFPSLVVQTGSVACQITVVGYAEHPDQYCEGDIECLVRPYVGDLDGYRAEIEIMEEAGWEAGDKFDDSIAFEKALAVDIEEEVEE